MPPRSRLRAFGVAVGLALVFLLATRQLGCGRMYGGSPGYRAQVDAFLAGRLALSRSPDALAHDLAWTPSGVQQVWGLGVPMWQTPFEVLARAVGQDPFPDRVALLVWLALAWFVLLRAFRREDEHWWVGAGSALIVGLLPAFVTMMRGRVNVYEEAAAYAYTAAAILLGGVVAFARKPTRGRYLLLLAAAGLTGLIRPTVWFYGLATAIIATAIYARAEGRRGLRAIALGAALFVAGGGVLYATNAARFGSGAEFGHRLNIESLPGNIYATRFSYPFARDGWIDAGIELAGSLFGRPELAGKRAFYEPGLHPGQSEVPRWREYYFTTFTWWYVPAILAGLVLGALAWLRKREDRWLALWAVLGAAPLVVFYLHTPSISSRYILDLAPAIAALLVIAWRAVAKWRPAPFVLVALWAAALLTTKTRGRIAADLVDRDTAAATRDAISRAPTYDHPLPDAYTLGDPQLAPYLDGKPPHLYLNGSGWNLTTGRVPPATHFYMRDPQFVEVETVPADAQVQVAIGPVHLVPAGTHDGRQRFELPAGVTLPGLQVAFVAFGPDTDLDRPLTDVVLRSIRWH